MTVICRFPGFSTSRRAARRSAPYLGLRPAWADPKFFAQVTEPEPFVNASQASPLSCSCSCMCSCSKWQVFRQHSLAKTLRASTRRKNAIGQFTVRLAFRARARAGARARRNHFATGSSQELVLEPIDLQRVRRHCSAQAAAGRISREFVRSGLGIHSP
jgi:hypothetical protein